MITRTIVRGTQYRPRIAYRNKNTGEAFTVTAYTCKWALKANVGDTEYAVDPVAGTTSTCYADFTVDAADTAALTPGTYYAGALLLLGTEVIRRDQYALVIGEEIYTGEPAP